MCAIHQQAKDAKKINWRSSEATAAAAAAAAVAAAAP